MPRDLQLLRLGRPIEEGTRWPRPTCAACRAGHLKFGEPEYFENGQSWQRRQGHDDWEPDWIFGTFRVDAVCENDDCKQTVVAVGKYEIGFAEERIEEASYSAFYRVEYLSPALPLLQMPDGTPKEVQGGVLRASSLLFADPGAAATALRAAVERYLTTAGISRTKKGGGFASLADRIELWRNAAEGREKVAGLLTAIRWIGNAGTHEMSDLTVEDVLDGVEFLDEAFHSLFVGPDIDARAQAINTAKGPPRTP